MNRTTLALFALASSLPAGTILTTSAAGADTAAIQTAVDQFRTSLGALNANVPGSAASGRREINWDGVPDGFSSPNALPGNFFNSNSPRGVVSVEVGGGTGFRASANSGVGTVRFGELQAAYATDFQTFSAQRLFTPLGNNVMDVLFFVPGSATPAAVSGFGAVFVDVDLASLTSMEAFDVNGNSLELATAGVAGGGLSFLSFRDSLGEATIARVRLTLGNTAIGAAESANADVVVLDDFIFGEPQASGVPEPSTLLLSAMGLAAVCWRRRAGARQA